MNEQAIIPKVKVGKYLRWEETQKTFTLSEVQSWSQWRWTGDNNTYLVAHLSPGESYVVAISRQSLELQKRLTEIKKTANFSHIK